MFVVVCGMPLSDGNGSYKGLKAVFTGLKDTYMCMSSQVKSSQVKLYYSIRKLQFMRSLHKDNTQSKISSVGNIMRVSESELKLKKQTKKKQMPHVCLYMYSSEKFCISILLPLFQTIFSR